MISAAPVHANDLLVKHKGQTEGKRSIEIALHAWKPNYEFEGRKDVVKIAH